MDIDDSWDQEALAHRADAPGDDVVTIRRQLTCRAASKRYSWLVYRTASGECGGRAEANVPVGQLELLVEHELREALIIRLCRCQQGQ